MVASGATPPLNLVNRIRPTNQYPSPVNYQVVATWGFAQNRDPCLVVPETKDCSFGF